MLTEASVDQWKSIWSYAESLLPPHELENPHLCIFNPLLQNSLLRLRKWLIWADSLRSNGPVPDKSQNDLTHLWAYSRAVKDCTDLLKHFIYLPNMPPPACLTRNHEAKMTLEAAMTLTLFCTIRKYVHFAPLGDTDIELRDASYMIAPKLHDVIEAALICMTHEERERYAEALFWMYFTGALFEQGPCIYQQQMLEQCFVEEKWWFSRRLGQQAKLSELKEWKQARRLLERFAYSDILEPHPEGWWDGLFEMKC